LYPRIPEFRSFLRACDAQEIDPSPFRRPSQGHGTMPIRVCLYGSTDFHIGPHEISDLLYIVEKMIDMDDHGSITHGRFLLRKKGK